MRNRYFYYIDLEGRNIMSKKPTVLMILDGYGLNDKCEDRLHTKPEPEFRRQHPQLPDSWRYDVLHKPHYGLPY